MPEAFCVVCRKMVNVQNPKTVLLKNNSLAITGTCPVSGTRVYKFAKRHTDPISALKIAIEREKEAQTFYRDAASKTEDPNGQKMLKWLAKEESWHELGLQRQLKSMLDKHAWQEWKEETPPLTEKDLVEASEIAHTREATSYKHVTGGITSALRTGMRAEAKAIQFYGDFAAATTDPNGKKTFESLVKQEQGHLSVLKRAMETYGQHKRFPMLPYFLP